MTDCGECDGTGKDPTISGCGSCLACGGSGLDPCTRKDATHVVDGTGSYWVTIRDRRVLVPADMTIKQYLEIHRPHELELLLNIREIKQ